jgi:hypothetical protein
MGWSTSSGPGSQAVAAAFYVGKKLKRGNCETDGSNYFLFGNCIARRIRDEDIPMVVADVLSGKRAPSRKLEYRWAYVSNTTQAHLDALGIRAHRANGKPHINGVPVNPARWYTPDEIAALKAPVKVPRAVERRCNATLEMFA